MSDGSVTIILGGILDNTSVHILACLVSSKSGAGVPSELPLITSRHWFTSEVESLKKLYNKTYIMFRNYTISIQHA